LTVSDFLPSSRSAHSPIESLNVSCNFVPRTICFLQFDLRSHLSILVVFFILIDTHSVFHRPYGRKAISTLMELNSSGSITQLGDKDSDWSPLHSACEKGNAEIVELLLKAGADTFKESREGLTPLHLAAANGNVRVVEILIKAKANLNPVDNQRFTPLHFACQNGHVDVVKLLLNNGANPNIVNKNGHKPHEITADPKVLELFKDVISTSKTTLSEDVNSTILHQR
jgi:hypothetical protein